MIIKFTQEYFKTVVPDWYNLDTLSGGGTLEEQICEYEKEHAMKDGLYLSNLRPGKTEVEIFQAQDVPIIEDTCRFCLSKSCPGDCPESTYEPDGSDGPDS